MPGTSSWSWRCRSRQAALRQSTLQNRLRQARPVGVGMAVPHCAGDHGVPAEALIALRSCSLRCWWARMRNDGPSIATTMPRCSSRSSREAASIGSASRSPQEATPGRGDDGGALEVAAVDHLEQGGVGFGIGLRRA